MKEERRDEILKRFFLSIWAMVTLVLLFMVGVLVYELIGRNGDPLALLRTPEERAAESDPAVTSVPALAKKRIELYFAAPDGRALRAQPRSLEYRASTVANCRAALEALLEGPQGELVPLLPESTRIRALYLLEDGELVVDFARELRPEVARRRSAVLESLLVYGITNTLTQESLQGEDGGRVRRVRFLFEGVAPQDTATWHLDLSRPVERAPQWIGPGPGQPAHG